MARFIPHHPRKLPSALGSALNPSGLSPVSPSLPTSLSLSLSLSFSPPPHSLSSPVLPSYSPHRRVGSCLLRWLPPLRDSQHEPKPQKVPAQRQGLARGHGPLPQEVGCSDTVLARGHVEGGSPRRSLPGKPHGTATRPGHGGAHLPVSDGCGSTLTCLSTGCKVIACRYCCMVSLLVGGGQSRPHLDLCRVYHEARGLAAASIYSISLV